MDAFLIPGTKNSPKIDFRPDNGIFEISGKSFHENPQKIYSGTLDWIKKLTLPSNYNGCLSINLTYISSNSMIYLLRILKAIEEVFKSNWLGKGPKTDEFIKKFANKLIVDTVGGYALAPASPKNLILYFLAFTLTS